MTRGAVFATQDVVARTRGGGGGDSAYAIDPNIFLSGLQPHSYITCCTSTGIVWVLCMLLGEQNFTVLSVERLTRVSCSRKGLPSSVSTLLAHSPIALYPAVRVWERRLHRVGNDASRGWEQLHMCTGGVIDRRKHGENEQPLSTETTVDDTKVPHERYHVPCFDNMDG